MTQAELNIILLRVNNFDIKQKRHVIFVLLYATNTKQDLGKENTANFSRNTSFFVRTELQHTQLQLLINHFILIIDKFAIIYSG